MRVKGTVVLLAAGVSLCVAQPQPKANAVADGVFVGRSGKPMANAKLFMGEVTRDDNFVHAQVSLPRNLPSAVTDAQGRFQFKGFPPGKYTIVYQPAGAAGALPIRFSIRALSMTDQSIAPGLRGIELGTTDPMPDRAWTRAFTLLKGHTLMTAGQAMKIWNATLRRNPGGPYLEMRRGVIWLQEFGEKSQIKLDAWSY